MINNIDIITIILLTFFSVSLLSSTIIDWKYYKKMKSPFFWKNHYIRIGSLVVTILNIIRLIYAGI